LIFLKAAIAFTKVFLEAARTFICGILDPLLQEEIFKNYLTPFFRTHYMDVRDYWKLFRDWHSKSFKLEELSFQENKHYL
jgi:hypothetical protein